MVRANMEKIRGVMARVDEVLGGLTRGIDLEVLDTGVGEVNGSVVSFFPHADSLGVVLPSNSPGVHSLWAPAFVLKTPLVLKPGSAEPWTPYRMIQALMRAGAPPEAFSFYPTDHAGGGEILRRCGRGMVFGDVASTRPWQRDSRVEVHGPGYSKVVLGEDVVDRWEEYLEVIASSIAANSGRSCVNASGVWTPRHGDAIAEALAERLARIEPRAADDPNAEIAPFANPVIAERIDAMVERDLPGAREVSAAKRPGGRLATRGGCSYLLPSVVRCDADHPLANREFLFPFASVVEAPQSEIPEILGPTLVLTAITDDDSLIRRLLSSPLIGRLNLGPVPTNQIVWDQPHEGNLFEHLYGRRAFQRASNQ
jgi:acyl-CoA reductase-like NAD-dependent aldehyde dehydrogenase